MRARTVSERCAPLSTPPRFEMSVVVRGCSPVPEAAASRSRVSRGEESVRVDDGAEAGACESVSRHYAGDAHRRELAEDEERDLVADTSLESARELVVDDHLTGRGRGS